MTDFENQYIKGKTLEQLIDGLMDPDLGVGTAMPGSVVHEMMKLAIQAKIAERLVQPRRWAAVSLGAAVVSALAAATSAGISAF